MAKENSHTYTTSSGIRVEEIDSDDDNDNDDNNPSRTPKSADEQEEEEEQEHQETDGNFSGSQSQIILWRLFLVFLLVVAIVIIREIICFFTKTSDVLTQVENNGIQLDELRTILRNLTG